MIECFGYKRHIVLFGRDVKMAKLKGKGVVLAGLVAGVASYLSKKDNRDKVMSYFSQAKENGGVQGFLAKVQNMPGKDVNGTTNNGEDMPKDLEKTIKRVATTEASTTESEIDGNELVEEGGAQQTLAVYNEMQENPRFDEQR